MKNMNRDICGVDRLTPKPKQEDDESGKSPTSPFAVSAEKMSDDVSEDDSRYCEYIWDLLGDPERLSIRYDDLLKNEDFAQSPAGDGGCTVDHLPGVTNLLKDVVENGRIFFYSRSLYVNIFSNFHMEPLEIEGMCWKSGEHYYQSAKFAAESPYADPAIFGAIRDAATPEEAKQLADARLQNVPPLPPEYRIKVMKTMLYAKFAPGTQMLHRLLQTGDLELVHESKTDFFWGQSRSGEGQNLLGRFLMQIRRENHDNQSAKMS